MQAISALTSSIKDKKRLLGVDGYGKVEIMSETVSSEVVPATNSFPYQKVIFSDNFNNVELVSLFVVPKTGSPLKLLQKEEEKENDDGIFVQSLEGTAAKAEDDEEGEKLKFTEKSDGVYIEKGSETKVKIDLFGRIFINDKTYSLRLLAKEDSIQSDSFSLIIADDKDDLAVVFYNQNFGQNAKQIAYNSSINAFFPGVYVQPASSSQKYSLTKALSRSSNNEPKGFYLLDTETNIDESQMPGFGYTSLENAGDKFGVGYSGDNKQMLLFASGNSIGESSLPYASDSGIVYGDPMIRLKIDDDLISQKSGYSKGLGKAIFSSPENIQELVSFDFNGDDADDLLLVYEDGLVRLLENEISNKRFKDRGYVLNIINGIFSLAKIDANNDGFDDLVVGTKESCKADEECVNLVTNYNGQLVTTPLNLTLNKRKIYEMKAYDMDKDGCEDLVTSDSSGTINIFYNQIKDDDCKGLNTTPEVSKNFGFSFEEGKNLSESLFINYPGMEEPDGKDISLDPSSNSYKFAQFILQKKEPTKEPSKTSNFIFIKEDGVFSDSKKQAVDENGGVLELNDKVNFLITLKNSGNKTATGVMISDSTPATMTLDLNSLKCSDPDCPDKLEWSETGASLRSHVIGGISVPKNGKRTIKYSATINKMPEIGFDVGKDFGDYPKDDYYDILVKPQVNPEKVVTYFYSTGKKKYSVKTAVPSGKNTSDEILAKAFKDAGLPDPASMMQASAPSQTEPFDLEAFLKKDLEKEKPAVNMSDEDKEKVGNFSRKLNEDKDYSGCTDSWDNLLASQEDSLKAVASFVENTISALQCSGAGCLPIPYNYAFFAPDFATPGIAVFAIIPYKFWVDFFRSSFSTSLFRIYVSPTLTLGLGVGICTGPNHYGPCYPIAVPGGIPGLCDLVNDAVEGALESIADAASYVKNSVIDPIAGQAAIITDGSEMADDNEAVNLGGSWSDPDSPISANAEVNIKIPGFPSIFTNWLDNQTDEIYNKLLDFPKFYLILPDFPSLAKDIKQAAGDVNIRSINDFLYSISSIPLLQIEGREVVVKIPAISEKEIYKYKEQWRKWKEYEEKELEKYNFWKCDENPDRKTICDKILLDMQELMSSVKKLMDLLDHIANLPKEILNYRNLEAKYATQIICYLDAIMTFTGGYIKRQEKILLSWMEAIKKAIQTFKEWKVILELAIDYQASCDKCLNDRFSKLGILLQLFIAIPDLPVIPMPKWPDIVVDFSKIKAGVKILWPDVVFRPEPIYLPNLPTIKLPEILPEVSIKIPGFEVPDFDLFFMPKLPDLPPLPLPKLPDLPRPPKIPKLPKIFAKLAVTIEQILKILCLLKNGIIAVPEFALATEIETLTQPNINIVIPLIKSLGVQWPGIEYDYVKEIRIEAKLNFDVETKIIYQVVQKGADEWNKRVKKFVKEINKITQYPLGEIISRAIEKALEAAKKAAVKAATEQIESVTGDVGGEMIEASPDTSDAESSLPLGFNHSYPAIITLKNEVEELNKTLSDFVATVETDKNPETYNLIAENNFIDKNHPLLGRTLEEIERDIKIENLPDTPYMKDLAGLRDNLIAYTKDLNSGNNILKGIEKNGFTVNSNKR